jgi:sRNA-binding regulator protein Hfq
MHLRPHWNSPADPRFPIAETFVNAESSLDDPASNGGNRLTPEFLPKQNRASEESILTETTLKERQEAAAFNGTRKLIRPHLPVQDRRRDVGPTEDPLSHAMIDTIAPGESSHAEAFYFQKQIQLQTEMSVLLDDGEELRGIIEWYDKCVVKMRVGRQRIMVYKSGIKYLFKSSESYAHPSVMK